MILNMDQFGRLFVDFTRSATRIETLPVYTVEEEREQLELYLAGEPLPANRNAEWAANIRKCVADGKYMGRVHIIDHVLTPYLRFEIDWYYTVNSSAGEDIRFIYREDVPDVIYTDTWLFDDTVVVDLSYTEEGELLYINRNDHPERVEQARRAWREFYARSFPLARLLAGIRGGELAIPAESEKRSWTTDRFARNS
ncbi:hypothetical protein SAMN05216188_12054 [Lentzea xinjiangensis]|uniref:DUF6879 domain-containing protein n=1 Tax=Lentzea xinjiangensis TaxID=402600 RepID=A0A1H9U4J5_9PSEU|nr:DUF6879 family protein [Lentzea xinjiangensis]SES03993.1 hypothetical protein SAMN05216188_12054 [Lentzea xinjiangensis]